MFPSTSHLNVTLAAHLRNKRLHKAIADFTTSPFHLRDTTTHNLMLAVHISDHKIPNALHQFDEMPQRDVVSYNTLISALAPLPAFHLFKRMLRSGISPTGPTFSSLLPSLPHPSIALQVHAIAVQTSLNSNPFVGSALIVAYRDLNDPDALTRAFHDIEIKNEVTWTVLVNGLMDLGRLTQALQVFDEMPQKNTKAYAALIQGYIKNGDMKSARKVFNDPTVEKNVITWATMVDGYNKIKRFREALSLFVLMDRAANIRPNPFTYSAALFAAASLASLAAGEAIPARILKLGWSDHVLATCLVEMYGKCGDGDGAVKAFDESELETRNTAVWNAVIGACGKNGRSDKAVELFHRILTEGGGARPDAVTAVNVLTACSHGGLIGEGERIFERMETDFGIKRGIEHYGCLVDLYTRAGMREEAERVVAGMPMEADAAALGLGFERRIRVCEERGDWGRMGELKEERERVVGRKKGRAVSWVDLNYV